MEKEKEKLKQKQKKGNKSRKSYNACSQKEQEDKITYIIAQMIFLLPSELRFFKTPGILVMKERNFRMFEN